ncbi:MAG TPA: hypothetical protein VMT87_03805 [Vicinamibacteria bacterium]|nr:hypothetical protein [Vicinamibacteria bacterium]
MARAKPPLPARPVEPLIPEPPPEDAPPTIEDLPIIPFKALEDEPSPARMSVWAGAAGSLEETDLADQLALVIQREVAEGHAVVIGEEDLEELDLVEDDRYAAREQTPAPAAAVALARGLNRVVEWSTAAVSAVRGKAKPAGAVRAASPPDPVAPPPRASDLPVVPFAAEASAAAPRRRLGRLAGVAAAALAVAVAAGLGLSRWMTGSEGSRTAAEPAAPPPPPAASEPQWPPEVVAAAQRLPHLAPDTVELLLATSPFGNPEPSEVFRRARTAARRGVSALTPEEAQELAVLERAVLVRLGPAERERVMAYDRLRAGRDLIPAEDARVLGLVARGTRALPAPHRERLRVLSGKAIAAALASGGQPAEAPRP